MSVVKIFENNPKKQLTDKDESNMIKIALAIRF